MFEDVFKELIAAARPETCGSGFNVCVHAAPVFLCVSVHTSGPVCTFCLWIFLLEMWGGIYLLGIK